MREEAFKIIAKHGYKYFNLTDLFALRGVNRFFRDMVDKSGFTALHVADHLLLDARFWEGFSESASQKLLQLFPACNTDAKNLHEALVYAILSPDREAAQLLLLRFQRELLNLLFQSIKSAPERIVRVGFLWRQLHLRFPKNVKLKLNELNESEKMLFFYLVGCRKGEQVLPHIPMLPGYNNNLLAELEESIINAPSEVNVINTQTRIYRYLGKLWLIGEAKDKISNLEKINFAGANIKGALLRFINFTGATFCGAYLEKTEFSWSILEAVNFTSTCLTETYFSNVNLKKANFSEVDLRRTTFSDVNLEGANFSRANLSGVNLEGLNLAGCDFSGANLTAANLEGANLEGAKFENAILDNASIFPNNQSPNLKIRLGA